MFRHQTSVQTSDISSDMSLIALHLILCGLLAIAVAQSSLPGAQTPGGPGNSRVGLALVSNGVDTPAEDVPWHAAVYMQDGNKYQLRCGGTLIASALVITAAHCFWDKHPNISAAAFKVTLGKYYSAYHVDFDTPAVQYISIKNISLHPRYRDRQRNYEYDVALLVLTSPANLTRFVQVAHLDWTRSLDDVLAAGVEGVVAGWGLTVNSTGQSEALQSIFLPYVDEDSCYEAAPQDARYLVTRGKFCAGYRNSKRSVCPGDSGGGYIVKGAGNKTFILGIVSTNLQPLAHNKLTCYSDHYSTFTNLTDDLFLRWLRGYFAVGDSCGLKNGARGVCRRVDDCPSARIALDSNSTETPEICFYYVGNPIVCCDPNPAPPSGKSWQKCLEYVSAVNRTVPSPHGVTYPAVVDQCFLRSSRRRKRIVGGSRSLPKEFPHMAALGYGDLDKVKWRCAGSLISHRFVLTTAVCLFGSESGNVRWARLGDSNVKETYDDDGSATYSVEARIPHPRYRDRATYDNIALLKLSENVVFNAYVIPACLNTIASTQQGQTATATGWGVTTQDPGAGSDDLLKVELRYDSPQHCNSTYAPFSGTAQLLRGITDETMFCAGDLDGIGDTCKSDSGGPLQTLLQHPSYCVYSIVGLTSFGPSRCGLPNTPSVYTRVSYYVPWIESIVWPSDE